MQNLKSIQDYQELAEGTDATFVHPMSMGDNARLIKMRVNAPQAVNLWLTPVEYDYENEEVAQHLDNDIFLGHVAAGFDQLEFYYLGSFCLKSVGGPIWLDTFDGATYSVEASDPTSYARIFEREERDPRILEMERASRHNMERLRAEMAVDREKLIKQIRSELQSSPSVDANRAAASGSEESTAVPPAKAEGTDNKVSSDTGGEPETDG